ncbi:MAG: succinate dehydrogenase, cytochrome b556 subunit [Alphaproteobacteria bacterium]|nr:succinate dehydrogenase, cytochrome b556 subunit [Alphaproteobacteria bacterium]
MSFNEKTQLRAGAAYRRDWLWIAALVHRLSGVALAIFLPLHFLALGLAMEGDASLDGFLKWTDNPLVKLAETGLVVLLTVHLLGGIRVLLIENLTWQSDQKSMAVVAICMALGVGLFFAINLI